ncbi:MAG: DUF1385 domain-containing protein, partial [Clostridia bacterium]
MKKIGGMATFNGVLLRDETTEVNAYYIDDDIYLDKKYSNTTKYPIFIRGYISLVNMYKLGIKYITDSAEYILKIFFDIKYKITNKELGISYFIAFVMFILIYIIVPNVISCLTNIVFL